ncbi:hypothetical protein PCH_Pc22g19870 [Penicillium rubens Wisconsin 54-1255]|uniref:Uncharacterized protein n=1 Tax=Penicillium rubens (strain ATCC 28089 / DSM 1075 / NRRL 1951 / Wisconsin 54-1255) TaxID=500485 RepID=B6HQ29_PENRW|nr:hypothetical protein PCH_Pc22g19870 [Penicillium rubens Wisconsin 54-1255]
MGHPNHLASCQSPGGVPADCFGYKLLELLVDCPIEGFEASVNWIGGSKIIRSSLSFSVQAAGTGWTCRRVTMLCLPRLRFKLIQMNIDFAKASRPLFGLEKAHLQMQRLEI